MKLKLRFLFLILFSLLFFTGCTVVEKSLFDFGLSMERKKSAMEPQSVIVEGKSLSYLERKGDGETMVLLHGFGADKENWLRFTRYIPKSFRVIAFDLPGHGESSLDFEGPYDIFSMEKRLSLAFQQIGLTRFHLAGNSMGGLVSIIYSLNHPEDVLSLGLFDSAGISTPVKSDLMEDLGQGGNPLIITSLKGYDDLLALCFEKMPFFPWPARNVMARQYMERGEHNKKMWNDLFGAFDDTQVRDELVKLDLPVLVLWGDKDRVLDISCAMVFKSLIPNAQLNIIKNCGHVPMVEYPEQTAGIYISFVQGQK